jgi:molecular chaperone GrpE (heat shock protein)
MAKLSDKDKAAAILGDVEEETPAETTETTDAETQDELDKPEDVETTEEDESDEEKPHEDEKETEEATDSTFTKQFPNLKGETLEDYNHELETAYDNSFKEALRLSKELKDNAAIVEQAKQIVAKATQPADNPQTPATPAPAANLGNVIDEHPAIKYAQAKQTEDMLTAFDDFKKAYPQATDEQAFEQFRKASDGVNATLTATYGRAPTYTELFPAIARTLGWQPTADDAKKNAVIKENTSIGRTPSNQAPARPKPSKVSDAQIDTYLKMFTSKTREEARKELSEVT